MRMALAARWAAAQHLQAAARGFLVRRRMRAQVQFWQHDPPTAQALPFVGGPNPCTSRLTRAVVRFMSDDKSLADVDMVLPQNKGAHEIRLYVRECRPPVIKAARQRRLVQIWKFWPSLQGFAT